MALPSLEEKQEYKENAIFKKIKYWLSLLRGSTAHITLINIITISTRITFLLSYEMAFANTEGN